VFAWRAPCASRGIVQYAYLDSPESLVLSGFIRPANSIKQFLLPRHESLFSYQTKGRRVELAPAAAPAGPQVILAARPCDAAALPVLDHVFGWDVADGPYFQRRQSTTVITLACQEHDEHCFCTSVGMGPDNQRGSDAMLLRVDDEHLEVRICTDKGRESLAEWTITSERSAELGPPPERSFSIDAVQRFLAGGFEHPFWNTAALRCLGCGACAHNCPTCHCFDIVDEAARGCGQRVRNWDSCQLTLYSLHASGHNPRNDQAARQRNRIFHKYSTYPKKFGDLLCTGCGACTRNCPVSLGVRGVLEQLQNIEPVREKEPTRDRTIATC
jgi:ferredoxin